uniref:7TM GPCR serpentine receptor class x (Srx) domain-containing protein n=1 Tax=Panagrolaimus sp. PS1159 TaxID=55785 RepID=A0AC35FI64_9BILA
MRFLAILCFTYSVYLIISILPTYFYVASNINEIENTYEIIFWGCILDNFTALNCLLSSLVFLLPYRKLFQWRSSKITMTNVAEIQRQLYFEQLRKQWT